MRLLRAGAVLIAVALSIGAWVARPMLLPPAGAALASGEGHRLEAAGRHRASVLLLGDTHFGESYSRTRAARALEHDRYGHPLARLGGLLASADVVVANLETPLVAQSPRFLRTFKDIVHSADPERTAVSLRQAGIDAVSLANNHACDAFGSGLVSTLRVLDDHGLVGFGGGPDVVQAARPLRVELEVGGRKLRIAVIGAFEGRWKYLWYGAYATSTGGGTYLLSKRTIQGQIRTLKQAEPDLFLIAFPHWGKNYAWRSEAQVELAEAMVQAGADVVVGHGAHSFQEIELRHQALVAYGIGNFVFLSRGRYARAGAPPYSIALRLDFEAQGAGIQASAVLYFLASNNETTGYQPRLLEGREFSRAADLLLGSGGLAPEARARIRRAVAFGRDRVGSHLRIDLGRVAP